MQKVIGFVGAGQNNLIIGSAYIIARTNRKVLIMDYTETGEQQGYLPMPKNLKKVHNDLLEYRGVYYIYANEKTDMDRYVQEYDMILAGFGHGKICKKIKSCDLLYLLTDLYPDNIEYLKTVWVPENVCRYLIIKNYYRGIIDYQTIAEELEIKFEKTLLVEPDEKEEKQLIKNLYFEEYRTSQFSRGTEEVLFHIAGHTGIGEKEGKAALRQLGKGKYI